MKENRIGSERVRMRISQVDLAKMISVSNKTLSLWEQNNRQCPTKRLVELAGIFNCTTDYLLGISDERAPRVSA